MQWIKCTVPSSKQTKLRECWAISPYSLATPSVGLWHLPISHTASSLSFSQSKNKSVCLMCNCEEVKSVVCERHAPECEPHWFRTHPHHRHMYCVFCQTVYPTVITHDARLVWLVWKKSGLYFCCTVSFSGVWFKPQHIHEKTLLNTFLCKG